MQAGALAVPSTSTAAPGGPLEDNGVGAAPLQAQPLPDGPLEDGPLAGGRPDVSRHEIIAQGDGPLEDELVGDVPVQGLMGQAGPVEGPLAALQLADGPVGAGRGPGSAGGVREDKARMIRPPRGRPRGMYR